MASGRKCASNPEGVNFGSMARHLDWKRQQVYLLSYQSNLMEDRGCPREKERLGSMTRGRYDDDIAKLIGGEDRAFAGTTFRAGPARNAFTPELCIRRYDFGSTICNMALRDSPLSRAYSAEIAGSILNGGPVIHRHTPVNQLKITILTKPTDDLSSTIIADQIPKSDPSFISHMVSTERQRKPGLPLQTSGVLWARKPTPALPIDSQLQSFPSQGK